MGSGDQALYVSGAPSGLAAGQFGVFDKNGAALTTVALGETVKDEIFVAVGTGSGKYLRSPGYIKAANIKAANFQCYQAGVAPVILVSDLCSSCSGEFAVKIHITAANAWQSYGFNQFVKTFTSSEACCSSTPTCKAILKDIRDQINADSEGLFTALAVNPSGGATLNDAALDSWDYAVDGCPDLKITAVPPALADFCDIPNTYSFPTGLAVEVTTTGFSCCDPAVTITESVALVYPEGDGDDIKYAEYVDNGNVNGPYRLTESGVASSFTANAVSAGTYHQLSILYDDPIASEFLQYSDPKEALIAWPSGTTAVTLWTILDDQLGLGTETLEGAC